MTDQIGVTTIRVDPEHLSLASDRYAASAQQPQSVLWNIHQAGDRAPSYDGQFGPYVRGLAADAVSQIQGLLNDLAECSEYLARKSEEFEQADQAAQDGFYQLAVAMRVSIDQFGGLAQLPRWLLLGQRPPWIDPQAWRRMYVDDQTALVEEYRRQWAKFMVNRTPGSFRPTQTDLDYLEDAFDIYRNGLPDELFDPNTGQQIAPYLPVALFAIPDLPNGRSYLDPVSDQPRFSRYQYQDLEEYVDILRYSDAPGRSALAEQVDAIQQHSWSTAHYNLCGPDAVGYAVGVEEMMEVYIAFAGVNEDMLISNDTAWTYEIRDLYRELGWEAEQIGRFASSEHTTWLHWDEENRLAFPTFEAVSEKLAEGFAITPLVGVDSSAGTLSANPDAAVGHFVTISETMVTQDGTQLIRVYNSLEHR